MEHRLLCESFESNPFINRQRIWYNDKIQRKLGVSTIAEKSLLCLFTKYYLSFYFSTIVIFLYIVISSLLYVLGEKMLVENINLYAKELTKFKFFKSMIRPLKQVIRCQCEIRLQVGQIESLVAYGLGSMNDNLITQYQFACALALRNELNINKSIEIFDPSMGKVFILFVY